MKKKRRPLKTGHHLILGGVEYEIEEVEGMGGNAIVYRASYQDSLSRSSRHRVLIKELFPYEKKGWIFRDEMGKVVCKDEGKALFLRHKQSFYRGNEANLKLLERDPDQISGNLNSYEAYGTLYTVLLLHGGKTLEEFLEEKEQFQSLKEIAQCMIEILHAVEFVHRHQFLHLDISPDNILVIKKRVLLIDYNSIWEMGEEKREILHFHVKAGYSAPEMRLKSGGDICEATDLYSVCAVFFRMVTGKILSDEEIIGHGLKKCLDRTCPAFLGESLSAVQKAVQILRRGLHPVVRKRYQSAQQLKQEFDELVERIDGKGITHSSLWESSRHHLFQIKRQLRGEARYLRRQIRKKDGEIVSSEQIKEALGKNEKFLLKGSGGIGKTSFLLQIWEENMERYYPSNPVVCYIPLVDYQKTQQSGYIKKYLLQQLSFGEEIRHMEDAVYQLQKLLQEQIKGNVILLLDGINEAGCGRKQLILEIEELEKYRNTGVLVTDRSEEIKRYALRGFQTVQLQPLGSEEVMTYLGEKKIPCPGPKLLELLQNPMMMKLYEKTVKIKTEHTEDFGKEMECMQSEDNLMEAYFQSLCEEERRNDSGNEQAQLCYSYLTDHMLPDIAAEMGRKRKSSLTLEELYRVIERSYRNLKKGAFTKTFEAYLGKSRIMLQTVQNEREWFDYTVFEELMEKQNLLERTEQGSFRLIHENFIPYLIKKERQNRRQLYGYLKQHYMGRGIAGVCLAVILAAARKQWWEHSRPFPSTVQEIQVVKNAMGRLTWNLGILDQQLDAQFAILEQAMKQGVMENNEEANEELNTLIERKQKALSSSVLSVREGEVWIEALEIPRNTISLETLQTLYEKPKMFQVQVEQALGHIQTNLCGDSPYKTEEQRQALLQVYEEYLECYITLCYLQIQYVLLPLDEEAKEEVTDFLVTSQMFGKEMVRNEHSDKTQEMLQKQIKAAEYALTKAENEMKKQNYTVSDLP